MRPSSSSSELPASTDRGLTGPLFGSAAVDGLTSDGAWLCAMLEVEAALAAAGAGAGVVPAAAAAEIAAACAAVRIDVDEVGRDAPAAGTPVPALLIRLRAELSEGARPYLHLGATSQDVVDTALMLLARHALGHLLADLAGVSDRCAALAAAHRDSLALARTLLQPALPTTFGLRAAGWLVAVDEARAGVARVREQRLAVQLGGAAGTLASLRGAGLEVVRGLAAGLGLVEPPLPWHTDRVRVAELAGALGTTAGALGKIALDVVLLSQAEVAELGGGQGVSSTLPEKRNPVHAVLTAAAARRTPGLVATLLAAMPQEQERAAGAWQAEWDSLRDLLRLTAGAAAHARAMLEELTVDPARMRANLDAAGPAVMAESLAGPLASGEDALDPTSYLGSAGVLVDRALAAHRAMGA